MTLQIGVTLDGVPDFSRRHLVAELALFGSCLRDDYLADILEAARVGEGTRAAYPEVPWKQARDMRNLLVHAYFSVNGDIVWNTATKSVPGLAE
jgi:hypothetical protein